MAHPAKKNRLVSEATIIYLTAFIVLTCYWGFRRTQQEKAICFYNFWDIFVVYVTLIAVLFDFNHYRVNFIRGYLAYNLAVAVVLNFKNPVDMLCIAVTRSVVPPILGGFFLISLFVCDINGSKVGNLLNSLIQGKRVILMKKLYEVMGGEEEVNRIYEEHLRKQQGGQTDQENPEEDYAVVEEQAEERSPHEILGVSEDATSEQIRAAFKRKMLENHPDRTGGLDEEFRKLAEKRMKEINSAYDMLRKKAT